MHTPDARGFSCFVTGTDTEIGKTLITTALLHGMAESGLRCVGMKPVAAGTVRAHGVWRNEDVEAIRAASNVKLGESLIAPYVFHDPIAPHIAAEREECRISLSHIVDCYDEVSKNADVVIVEGVGGFCVPLSRSTSTADLARQLKLPVVLVVGMRLGCISHALLTAEAIQARGLNLAGWVANTIDNSMPYFQENVEALASRLPAPLLGVVPRLTEPCGREASAHLSFQMLNGDGQWPWNRRVLV